MPVVTDKVAVGIYVRFGRHSPEWEFISISNMGDNGCNSIEYLNHAIWGTLDIGLGLMENPYTGALSNGQYYNAYFPTAIGGTATGDYTKLIEIPGIPSSGSITLDVVKVDKTK